MTSFNRELFIAEAIESLLNSSYSNFELIIVDDNSVDNTLQIARSYATIDPRIKVFCNETNLGDYSNRNKAATYASGEFIMYLDSDDKITTDGIEMCVNAIQKWPYANFAMYYIHREIKEPFYLNSNDAFDIHFFTRPSLMIGPGGTLIRRDFFFAIGGYPELYGPANDLYFNLKAVSHAGVLFLPFEFGFYRIHEGQEQNNKFAYLFNNYNYLRDAINELDLSLSNKEKVWLMNKNRRRFIFNLARHFWKTKNISQVRDACSFTEFGPSDLFKGLFHFEISR
jgi:glycosyltransferase involved in cell wall biosynthesis